LAERGQTLRAAGFDEQVHVRPGSPLCFVHADSPDGPRYRLEPANGGFALVGAEPAAQMTAPQLSALAARDPLRLSTSALLRPIIEGHLLPEAAYVGGPGEIGYFAQVAPLYERFGLLPPIVVPRARFRVLEHATRALLGKLGLAAADVETSRDDAQKKM